MVSSGKWKALEASLLYSTGKRIVTLPPTHLTKLSKERAGQGGKGISGHRLR